MPLIMKDVSQPQVRGFTCDRCEKTWTVEDGFGILNYYEIDHVAGYGTRLDTTRVNAVLCDKCLFRVLLNELPGACFTDNGQRGAPIINRDVIEKILIEEE